MAEIERTRIRATPDGRLTRRDAARFLGVAERTLANWRSLRRGPPQLKVGRRVFYRLADLEFFINPAVA